MMGLNETGHICLILAWLVTGIGIVLPVCGRLLKTHSLESLSIATLRCGFVMTALAFAFVMQAFLTSDFSMAIVVANSHTLKPILYKIAGVWGNHEGSLLLWILILGLYGIAITQSRSIPSVLRNGAAFVQNGLMFLFLGLSLWTSNPFQRVFPPALQGNDLNPLLQDPALALHPPMLYLGYVGYSAVFALAMSGLWQRKIDSDWAKTVRPFALVAWTCLTAGLALGSWWAYYELGWGGWWFWDPVENAALLPWLTGTALFHSLIVLEKRNHLPNWTVLLALVCFCLSLLGTFLVRSGVITSVHAFASDPQRGLFILAVLAITAGGGFALYAMRRPTVTQDVTFALLSRETTMVINNLFLMAGMVTVLVGTLYPYILQSITGTLISVGPPYFALTFVPLMLPLLAFMALGPFIAWDSMQAHLLWQRIRVFLLATIFTVLLVLRQNPAYSVWSMVCLASGLWVILSSVTIAWSHANGKLLRLFRLSASSYALIIGHLGLGVAILGMTGSIFWAQDKQHWLTPGQTITQDDYTLTLASIDAVTEQNYNADRAVLQVQHGTASRTLQPEKRWYPVAEKDTTEIAIYPHGLHDLYVALGTEDERQPGRWSLRVSTHPLINMLWAGAGLLVAAGLFAVRASRKRSL